jgi:hypothetical protein
VEVSGIIFKDLTNNFSGGCRSVVIFRAISSGVTGCSCKIESSSFSNYSVRNTTQARGGSVDIINNLSLGRIFNCSFAE